MVRVPEVEGARNLRDVGGYPASGGRTTRWRTLYRSGGLHGLSPAGAAELFAVRSVRLVIDLRWPHEIDERPDAVPGEARYAWVPVLPIDTPPESSRRSDYRWIVEERADQVAEIARLLLRPGGLPAVVHCTEGIDRTGVAVALVLAAVGVVPPAIEADYRGAAGATGALRRSGAEIRSVLARARARYGGAAGLLRAGGLTAEDLDALRGLLTEPAVLRPLPPDRPDRSDHAVRWDRPDPLSGTRAAPHGW